MLATDGPLTGWSSAWGEAAAQIGVPAEVMMIVAGIDLPGLIAVPLLLWLATFLIDPVRSLPGCFRALGGADALVASIEPSPDSGWYGQ